MMSPTQHRPVNQEHLKLRELRDTRSYRDYAPELNNNAQIFMPQRKLFWNYLQLCKMFLENKLIRPGNRPGSKPSNRSGNSSGNEEYAPFLLLILKLLSELTKKMKTRPVLHRCLFSLILTQSVKECIIGQNY